MSTHKDFLLISDANALQNFCDSLASESWIAVDTEFHREQHYYPELCLVQIGTAEVTACIDPLAIADLSPLLEPLYNPAITKVMHAGRQDLEIFFHMRGELPQPIFDTQLAAPLLGLDEQMGYGPLVQALLNITLDKAHSRADWMRRPLPQEQLRYAADDVVYLAQLYPLMKQQLEELGRLQWLDEDFQRLTSIELYQNHPEKAWLKVRMAKRLKPKQLAVLQALAGWRETTAQKENKPRNWLTKDDVLLDIARMQPGNLTDLGHIRGINDAFLKRHGKTLLELIVSSREQTPQPLPDEQRRQKPSIREAALLDSLSGLLGLLADDNQLHPSAIASRKDLEALLRNDESPLDSGWRKQIAGNALQAFLQGDICLKTANGKLQLGENA